LAVLVFRAAFFQSFGANGSLAGLLFRPVNEHATAAATAAATATATATAIAIANVAPLIFINNKLLLEKVMS
jgi:hypothetical protein